MIALAACKVVQYSCFHPDYPSSFIQQNDFVHLHIVVRGKSVMFLI